MTAPSDLVVRFIVRGCVPDETDPAHDGLEEVGPWLVCRQTSADGGWTWDDDERWELPPYDTQPLARDTANWLTENLQRTRSLDSRNQGRSRDRVCWIWRHVLQAEAPSPRFYIYTATAFPKGRAQNGLSVAVECGPVVAWIPFATLRGDESATEIREILRQQISAYKHPRGVFADQIRGQALSLLAR